MSAVRASIDPTLSVNEVIRRYPASITVLNALGIDTCCGGADTLRAAALEAGADPGATIDAIIAAESSIGTGR